MDGPLLFDDAQRLAIITFPGYIIANLNKLKIAEGINYPINDCKLIFFSNCHSNWTPNEAMVEKGPGYL